MSAADTIHFTMNKPVGYIDVAITFAFNGRPFVFGLTAPMDQELPTWRIKSMSLRRVGPEQARQLRFDASVVTDAVDEDLLSGLVDLTGVE
ncbi:MAG: hypothetical protein WCO86_18660 [Planctomycetota bacterium]